MLQLRDTPGEYLLSGPRRVEIEAGQLLPEFRHIERRHDRAACDPLVRIRELARQEVIDSLTRRTRREQGRGRRRQIVTGAHIAVLINCGSHGGGKRLVEIGEDVVDVLDANTEPDGFRSDARETLLRRGHLPVRGRGRVTGQRFRIAQVH